MPGVQPGTPWRNGSVPRRRSLVDNIYFWSRAFIRAAPNTAWLRAGQMIENLEWAIEDTQDLVGDGWVPTPRDVTSGAELPFTAYRCTVGLTGGLNEFAIGCPGGVQYLAVGMKVRWGSPYSYGVVTAVPSDTLFVVVTPVGQQPPVAADADANATADLGLVSYSSNARPHGFPFDDNVWTARVASGTGHAVDAGSANDAAGAADGASFGTSGGGWTFGHLTIELPSGCYDLDYAITLEGLLNGRSDNAFIAVSAGIAGPSGAGLGNLAPPSEGYDTQLVYAITPQWHAQAPWDASHGAYLPKDDGSSPRFRKTLKGSRRSPYHAPGVNGYAINFHAAGVDDVLARTDLGQSQIRATLRL